MCPIGIDLGAHSVRLLQFRSVGGGLALQAAARTDLPRIEESADGTARRDQIAEVVRAQLRVGGFSGRQCVLSFTPRMIHAKSVRLPHMPDADLEQALQWEAKDRLGFELGEGRMAYFRAGELHRGAEVRDELLLFAVTGDVLRQQVEMASRAGLRIDAIDLQPCALLRALARVGPARPTHPVGVVDIGHRGTQFMLALDDRLVFYKYIEVGSAAMNEAAARKLGVPEAEAIQIRDRLLRSGQDDAGAADLERAVSDALRPPLEELARELDMCLRYYVVTFRGTRPEVLKVAGREACCGQVRDTLAGILGLTVEAAQPLGGVAGLNELTRPDRSGEWTVAAGLSLYSLAARAEVAA